MQEIDGIRNVYAKWENKCKICLNTDFMRFGNVLKLVSMILHYLVLTFFVVLHCFRFCGVGDSSILLFFGNILVLVLFLLLTPTFFLVCCLVDEVALSFPSSLFSVFGSTFSSSSALVVAVSLV